MNISERIEELMPLVQKPSRYIGNEYNCVIKDAAKVDVRYAFLFPDVYEIGMSHLGMKILYHTLNKRDDTWCERVFTPWPDMMKLMEENGVLVAAVAGEIDHHSAVLLREKVDRQIAARRPRKLCIDLSGVSFMDSSGLGFIMGRYRNMAGLGGEVSVKGAQGRIEAVLQMSGAYRYVRKAEEENT